MLFRKSRAKAITKEVDRFSGEVVSTVLAHYKRIRTAQPNLPSKTLYMSTLKATFKMDPSHPPDEQMELCAQSLNGICYIYACTVNDALNDLILARLMQVLNCIDAYLCSRGVPKPTKHQRRTAYEGLGCPPKVVDEAMRLAN